MSSCVCDSITSFFAASAQGFVHCHSGYCTNFGGASTLLLGATILHELAHWGDDQDGKDIPGEEGNMFETAAYGRVIPCLTK